LTTSIPISKVLLVCDDRSTSEKTCAALQTPTGGPFDLECVGRLSDGHDRLEQGGIAAVLLALNLPDSQGIETFNKLFAGAAGVPILILGEEANEALASQAVERGAQDYLLPGHLDSYSLPRALRNAIERKAVEDALFMERDRAIVTLNSIGDAVLCTDVSGNVTYLNLVAETMTGWNCKDAIGQPLAEVFRIIDGATREVAQDPMQMAVEQNRTVGLTLNCVLIRRDGLEVAIEDSAAPIHDRAGHVIGAVIVFHDVSAARAMTEQMTFAAQHDLVTALPNRMLLNDRIAQSISLAHRNHKSMALLFLDLDRFKEVNDSLGHTVGDKLLTSVAKRLVKGVRHSDTVSRHGGDEFVILLSEITHPEDAATSAEKLLLSLAAPHYIGGNEVHIGSSIGISIYPDDGLDAETLTKNADAAMYHAKESGRNNCQFFKPEMNLKAVARHSLESSMRHALDRDEFLLHYQPKIDLHTGKIKGVEALIRWEQNGGGLVPPAEFIPVAEACGLIVPIGRWVLRKACQQARSWQDAGLPSLQISVNVSAIELRDKDFVQGVKTILSETGLAARFLELEVTESVLMKDTPSTIELLQEVKRIGIRLAIDDFGTGYSSMSYLETFPIDVLKIDQSFVRKITSNPDDSLVVSAIINIAKSLKYLVIAEGVETREQKAYLQSRRCDWAQGFLFSRPLAAPQLVQLLHTGIHIVN